MSSSITKFDVIVQLFSDGTLESDAYNTYLQNMLTLSPYFVYNINGNINDGNGDRSFNNVISYISSNNLSSAMQFLNNMITVINTPNSVICNQSVVTSEP